MENTIGAANWLVGKVLNKLSNGLVAAYVASSELGLNSEKIKTKLKYMQGLLHFAQERDVSNNPGLHSLLQDLSKKADEAEDALDELHYFMIQDQLDSTQDAAPDLGDDLRSRALHGVHAASHTIGWCGSEKLPRDISRLVNLRYFHSSKEIHSNIPEVGKMKCLQELKEFNVKKESVGFELRELGELIELGGELSICNLESVMSKKEASDAKLKNKRKLKELRLVWCPEHRDIDDNVLDGLHPHPNLRVLGIINPGVAAGPSWLCGDISTKRLESLHLEGVSWVRLPSFEQLSHLTNSF
ncbi:hypothetical protein ACQ4PT_026923 [Festuca glaucescens]